MNKYLYTDEDEKASVMYLGEIYGEFKYATRAFGTFNSRHEGYAVIKEELDELWDAIKSNAPTEDIEDEVRQVGAMALRFMVDCCHKERRQMQEEINDDECK